jgi:uracil-DNA glycosylase family 4
MSKKERMEKIAEQIKDLQKSPLYEYRVNNNYRPVIGEGDLNAAVVFIGEAPGKNEAETGRPFCGRAGKFLDQFLAKAGLERDEVYITNVVKDRPPGNRRPAKDEVALYSPFLAKQLETIQPQVIVTLGKTATEFAFEKFGVEVEYEKFSDVVGESFQIEINGDDAILVPLYHPAYAIYQRTLLPEMEEEFKKIPDLVLA